MKHLGPFLPSPVKVNGHITGEILPVIKSVISRLALTDT